MITRATFAARLSRISQVASTWCAETLHPVVGPLDLPMKKEPVERYIKEMRERLDGLQKELNDE